MGLQVSLEQLMPLLLLVLAVSNNYFKAIKNYLIYQSLQTPPSLLSVALSELNQKCVRPEDC